ncbi:MAG: hypothetical protein R3E83_11705 [Burkholderiaceae bacterium]
MIALLTAAAPAVQTWSGLGSPTHTRMLGQTLPILAWLVPAAFVAAYCSARLINTHRHGNVLLEALPPMTIILYLVGSARPSLAGLSAATAIIMRCTRPLRSR